jgi:hypothetical protein
LLRLFWRFGLSNWLAYVLFPAVIVWLAWGDITAAVGCMVYSHSQPEHGLYARYTNAPGIVSLTITSKSGADYFIKFENPQTQSAVIAFFVNGGIPLHTLMPVGQFGLKSASGQGWCAETNLFGAGTSIGETDNLLNFEEGNVHTIRSTPDAKGNLRFHPIGRTGF